MLVVTFIPVTDVKCLSLLTILTRKYEIGRKNTKYGHTRFAVFIFSFFARCYTLHTHTCDEIKQLRVMMVGKLVIDEQIKEIRSAIRSSNVSNILKYWIFLFV